MTCFGFASTCLVALHVYQIICLAHSTFTDKKRIFETKVKTCYDWPNQRERIDRMRAHCFEWFLFFRLLNTNHYVYFRYFYIIEIRIVN